MKKTSDWILSHEVPSDITINAGGASFSLHKFPLAAKCGYIRKIVSNSKEIDHVVIEIPDVPGGFEGFELAAKFCYGVNFELSTENIATVRCVSEYLEMTEEYAIGNLVTRSESYLNEVGLTTLAGAVSILQSSANLLPMAEEIKLINRCIDTIAFIVTKESPFLSFGGADGAMMTSASSLSEAKAVVDWWAEDLIVLRIDMFQRVLLAMISRGFKQYALGPTLMLYAQKCLRGLEIFGKSMKNIEPKREHEKRIVLETIVSLLPWEKNAMSVSFLSMLLRASIYLETTMACRLDLEKRMGLQLGQAVLDDILIPCSHFEGETLFDVDTVQRVMMNYLEFELQGARDESDMAKVGKLMESYLAEIASDRNLVVSKFINIVECIPEQAKVSEDGTYRAIDIYLKAHPTLTDIERKKVCSLMDCQKLSREACAHAAQNDRLPVQTVVQVLYYEQQRLRDTMDSSGSLAVQPYTTTTTTAYNNNQPLTNELSRLKKENKDLKFELLNMKMRLKEIEKSSSVNKSTSISPVSLRYSADKPPLPKKSLINSVSKKLSKLTPFLRGDGILASSTKGKNKPSKDRRHSIS
ncbi:BTB/POZ domain-containing protein SR1IP1 [Rutidosis leptorrhynchoides]|uniref:BTB/POZ domain-containing protein SR1IP1 n=1 Tax=Rutidosis leptorrhynchoides TaxID=125765 RepID=UPI003A9A333C